jgi:hypothetical protein
MIEVKCSCGKRLRVKEDQTDKRLKCPSCGQPFQIADDPPGAAPGPDVAEVVGVRQSLEQKVGLSCGRPCLATCLLRVV